MSVHFIKIGIQFYRKNLFSNLLIYLKLFIYIYVNIILKLIYIYLKNIYFNYFIYL